MKVPYQRLVCLNADGLNEAIRVANAMKEAQD